MEIEEQNWASSKRKVLIAFGLFLVGIFLNFSAYLTTFGLQSSINIEDGVGVASGTAIYGTSTIFGVTLTPIVLRSFSAKACLTLCKATYLIYILANFYPAWYTLIPAGAIVGIGEATMWPAFIMLCAYYARCFAPFGSKEADVYVVEFIGVMFTAFNLSGVFGNLLSYGILSLQTSSDNESTTFLTPESRNLSVCGKNDCQDPNVTTQNIDNYVPSDKTLLYILLGVMAGLVLLAIIIHWIFIKEIDDNVAINDVKDNKTNKKAKEDKMTTLKSFLSTLKETGMILIHPKQLLLAPFALHSGLTIGFALAELTRAFGSCIIGVEYVGLFLAIYNGADAITSFVACKVCSRKGRHLPMLTGFCIDLGFCITILLWVPTDSTIWVVYILFAMNGMLDGFWQPLTSEMYNSYFPGTEDIALTIWNLLITAGIAWQTGWSTSLCVDQKVYFRISRLCFSAICYDFPVCLSQKTGKTNKENCGSDSNKTIREYTSIRTSFPCLPGFYCKLFQFCYVLISLSFTQVGPQRR